MSETQCYACGTPCRRRLGRKCKQPISCIRRPSGEFVSCALSFRSGRVKGKPIAGSGFRRRGSASNLQLSASCHGLSSLSPPCASAATGRRAAVRPEARSGSGPGRTPRGRQNLHFQVVLGKSKSSFPPPPFFSHPMRQAAGMPTGSRLPAGAPLPPSVFPQFSPTQPYLALSLQGAVVF